MKKFELELKFNELVKFEHVDVHILYEINDGEYYYQFQSPKPQPIKGPFLSDNSCKDRIKWDYENDWTPF